MFTSHTLYSLVGGAKDISLFSVPVLPPSPLCKEALLTLYTCIKTHKQAPRRKSRRRIDHVDTSSSKKGCPAVRSERFRMQV